VGQWAGHIFIYSRFEKNKGHKWYRLFRTKQRFPRGKSHLVTATFDKSGKAIYIDGQLSNKKNVALTDGNSIELPESFLLGNSPRGKNGWWGEIKGLVVYNRILLPDEVVTHSRIVMQKGVRGLVESPGCLALYPFDEGKGETAKSILNKPHPYIIPELLNALSLNMNFLSYKDVRFYDFNKADFMKNIIFFVPFGILLTSIILKKYSTGYLTTFLVVTFAGWSLSCVIEGFQLLIPTRYSGIADIIGNTLGSGFGMFVTLLASWKFQ
jgi:hypothetical protein